MNSAVLNKALQWAKLNAKRNALGSLYDYSVGPLSSDRKINQIRPQPHKEMCEFLQGGLPPIPTEMAGATQTLSMLLAPRNTIKSNCAVMGMSEYYSLKMKLEYNYDVRVAIGRASRDFAQQSLKKITKDFQQKAFLRDILGERGLNGQGAQWTNASVTLGWRDTNLSEPTFSTMGLGRSNAGEHYDVVILDDLINETNYESERAMEDAYNYIFECLPLLEPWGSLYVIGTRWGYNDPYGRLLASDEDLREAGFDGEWRTLIRSCYLEDGSLYYPERLTEKFLTKQRRRLTPKMFAAWYLNSAAPDNEVVFRPEYLQYYEGEYENPVGEPPTLVVTECSQVSQGSTFRVRGVTLCDTAVTTGQRSDHTGALFVLEDEFERWWIHDVFKVRETPSAVIARLVRMAQMYEPETISIETVGANELFVTLLEPELRKAGLNIGVSRFHPSTQSSQRKRAGMLSAVSKGGRIETYLEPKFRAGEVFIRRGLRPLITELTTYDGVRPGHHFDLLDALTQMVDVGSAPQPMRWHDDLEEKELAWRKGLQKRASIAPPEVQRPAGRWAS